MLHLAAIQYYRKAVQLVPDIEFKIDDEFRPIRRGDCCFVFYIFLYILGQAFFQRKTVATREDFWQKNWFYFFVSLCNICIDK